MKTSPTSNANLEKPTQDPPERDQTESLTKELMQCLSKEIETTMTNMMAFRTRIGFGMSVGPFLLLGSFIVGAKGQPVSFNLRWYGWAALLVDVVCFLGIAYIVSQIELQAWRQCNRWRRLIGELGKNQSEIDYTKLESKLVWRDGILGREWNGLTTGYLVGYFLLFLSVVAAMLIIKDAGTIEHPKSSETGATFRIEQVSPAKQ